MKSIAVGQLAEVINGKHLVIGESSECLGVSIDTRTIEPGQAFFAISGQRFDGHEYIDAAVDKGAVCMVVSRDDCRPRKSDAAVVRVDDTVAALGRLAQWYRQQLRAKVIGITGSVGKTTTRQILYQVLNRSFQCRQAQKSFNNNIGLPLTILSAESNDDVLLLELGSNHPGEIEVLTRIASPDMAVITAIGAAHLAGFGSVDNILKEKASIATGLKGGGVLYIYGDQPELANYVRDSYDVRTVRFGTNRSCEVVGEDLMVSGCGGSLLIEGRRISIPLAGRANLMNVLAAWAVCRDLGVSLSDFKDAVGHLETIPMRMEIQDIGSLKVLNDCYNANPISMENALSCLAGLGTGLRRRRVFVAGCMAELGDQSDRLHFELGRRSVTHGVDLLLAAGPCAERILEGASEAAVGPGAMQAFDTTEQLCDNLHKWIKADDIILVKGSRSANLEKAVVRLQQLFADRVKQSAQILAE